MKLEEMLRLLDAAENHPVLACRDKNILTRRDHFAMAALTGMLSGPAGDEFAIKRKGSAVIAYEFADAMEAARNKEGEK